MVTSGKKDGTTVQSSLPGLEHCRCSLVPSANYTSGVFSTHVCVSHWDGGGDMQVIITSLVSTHFRTCVKSVRKRVEGWNLDFCIV